MVPPRGGKGPQPQGGSSTLHMSAGPWEACPPVPRCAPSTTHFCWPHRHFPAWRNPPSQSSGAFLSEIRKGKKRKPNQVISGIRSYFNLRMINEVGIIIMLMSADSEEIEAQRG